jgi:lactoylglutathione lyase
MKTLHVGLRVADVDRSLAFYTSLGYQVVGTVPETEIGALTMLKLPGDVVVSLELVHQPGTEPIEPRGLSHLVVQVEDLHQTLDRLAAREIRVNPPSSPDGSEDFWTTMLVDPDGYRIELVQWPVGHADGLTAADFRPEGLDATPDQSR